MHFFYEWIRKKKPFARVQKGTTHHRGMNIVLLLCFKKILMCKFWFTSFMTFFVKNLFKRWHWYFPFFGNGDINPWKINKHWNKQKIYFWAKLWQALSLSFLRESLWSENANLQLVVVVLCSQKKNDYT